MGEAKQEVENKQEEKAEEKKEEKAAAGPPPPIVLSLDLHCVGCARKIEKCMLRCRGVESVEVDMIQNKVTVKGIVDPQALCSRIQKRTQRQIRVLSPLPPKEGDPKPEADPPQESGMSTVELLVNMHCEGCAEQLKRKILKMRGVQMAKTDMTAGKVTVTGTVTGKKIAEYIHRRTGKIASIVLPPPNEEEKKKEEKKPEEKAPEDKSEEKKKDSNEKKEEGKGSEPQENANDKKEGDAREEEKKEANIVSVSQDDMMKRMMYWPGNFGEEEMARRMMVHWMPVYMIQQPPPPPPQLFSDENPNACCIT
ncbi:heavy metal-associated isoprenylated plant protein 9-like [Curcuma longa]|uniref:heavy metal-associated isoprenylated plant protein 9-like n=1 Tax=Curcuma longa TaxID=136217 RepID=UPI003D9E7B54